MTVSALKSLSRQLETAIGERGLRGFTVVPDSRDLDLPAGKDLRSSQNKLLRLVVPSSPLPQVGSRPTGTVATTGAETHRAADRCRVILIGFAFQGVRHSDLSSSWG